ncbi:response regulator [bacterium]|nr:response regulator [bacterium]
MMKVLIVDDDEVFLESLIDGLEQNTDNFSYRVAYNGRQALEILQEGNIGVMVTDLKMPRMDGFDLIARAVKEFPELPCIVMTAYGTQDIERAFDDYSISYIEKPIEIDELYRLIGKAADSWGREGKLRGVTLSSFLQLIEMEQKTCRLDIHSSIWGDTGVLRFARGKLFDATLGKLKPDEAALKIMSWEDVTITVKKQRPVFKRRIKTPMMELQMEALRLADEENRGKAPTKPVLEADSLSKALELIEESDELTVESEPEPNPAAEIEKEMSAPKFDLEEEVMASLKDLMAEFNNLDGFHGIAVFTPAGELMGKHATGGLEIDKFGVDVNSLLYDAQKLTKEIGISAGHLVHVESDDAHLFGLCMNEGTDPLKKDPGKAHFHVVLMIDHDSPIGMVKMRLESFAQKSADILR